MLLLGTRVLADDDEAEFTPVAVFIGRIRPDGLYELRRHVWVGSIFVVPDVFLLIVFGVDVLDTEFKRRKVLDCGRGRRGRAYRRA